MSHHYPCCVGNCSKLVVEPGTESISTLAEYLFPYEKYIISSAFIVHLGNQDLLRNDLRIITKYHMSIIIT